MKILILPGFFRCRRPSAPDLYSYLEARSAAMNGGRSSLGGSNSAAIRMRRRRVSDSSLTLPVNATAAQRQAGRDITILKHLILRAIA